jgi:anti-sigma factor RsiW
VTRGWWRRRRLMCPEVARTLQSYLDGRIDDEWAARVAEHLEDCRRCGLKAQTYSDLKAALARQGSEVRPETLAELRSFAEGLMRGEIPTDPPGTSSPEP